MRTIREKLFRILEDKKERMTEIRRFLHENPELSFKEEKTAKYIQDFYHPMDVNIHTDVGNGLGIVVEINGNGPGKVIGLRADFDALPVQEEADVSFKSKTDGVMHACGHDAHTAYMLILAESLYELRDEWSGVVKIIHQHAEELPPGGAQSIQASGYLDDLDEVYGAHVFPMIDTGVIQFPIGNAMAGSSSFELKIKGHGGHAGMPQSTRDALVAASSLIMNAQTLVSRNTDPLDTTVFSITALDAPGGFNVIQDTVTLRGTARYLQDENKEFIYNRFKDMLDGLEKTYGVTCILDYEHGYPVVHNYKKESSHVLQLLKKSTNDYLTDVRESLPLSGSEDFSYYLQKTPGTYINIGAKPEGVTEAYPNHHPKFTINEDAMIIAAKAIGEIALDRLGE